jgi:hypothetical protein
MACGCFYEVFESSIHSKHLCLAKEERYGGRLIQSGGTVLRMTDTRLITCSLGVKFWNTIMADGLLAETVQHTIPIYLKKEMEPVYDDIKGVHT